MNQNHAQTQGGRPWPPDFYEALSAVPFGQGEAAFYGLYFSVLEAMFAGLSDKRVFIIPVYYSVEPGSATRSVDLCACMVLKLPQPRMVPIFFVELKVPSLIRQSSSRAGADHQMRRRFDDLFVCCFGVDKPSRLYGLSAFGSRCCLFQYNATLDRAFPRPQAPHSSTTIDTQNDPCPEGMWNIDINTAEAHDELRQVAQNILHILSLVQLLIGDYPAVPELQRFSLALQNFDGDHDFQSDPEHNRDLPLRSHVEARVLQSERNKLRARGPSLSPGGVSFWSLLSSPIPTSQSHEHSDNRSDVQMTSESDSNSDSNPPSSPLGPYSQPGAQMDLDTVPQRPQRPQRENAPYRPGDLMEPDSPEFNMRRNR